MIHEEESLDPIDIAAGALSDALRELRLIPSSDGDRVRSVALAAIENARYLQAHGGGGLTVAQLQRTIEALEKAL